MSFATVFLLIAALLGCRTPAPEVVVVGGGPAGLAAAWEASATRRVLLVEGEAQLGGSARWAQAVTAVPEQEDLAEWDAEAGDSNAARTRYAATVRSDVIHWTAEMGVSWAKNDRVTADVPLWSPDGGGMALVGALESALASRGVTIRRGVRVVGLSRGERWEIALADDTTVETDAVVLATGGTMADLERVQRELGMDGVPLLRGVPAFADGNGHDLAVASGARLHAPARAMLYGHGVPATDAPEFGLMLVDALPVLPVDASGTYLPQLRLPRGNTGKLVAGGGWAIVDRRAAAKVHVFDARSGRTHPASALAAARGLAFEDLDSLAERTGLSLEALEGRLADGKPTPERPLKPDEGGFLALPLHPTTAKSLTGVETDLDGRVLDLGGQPIPGLYAAGELAGFGHPYDDLDLDSTMVAGAILTGRAAGRAAAADRTR